ncbi:hypothetical protein Tdes44962_MAKER09807 [Teratosphaeria destructans]|uniref:BZIP domain-containing protein n=1 Tax=Teratosphaeria destructans TaxID=418781 RepID=A0A9W7SRC6_9PEZI|nr:hypothetical protein Tdes44962_MAKER09807 [Teratosphaeria destructans]
MAQDVKHQEQLARARRNQRRCRERKREYVTELEQQVESLRNTIRQCEPCSPSPRIETPTETSTETAVRENAARRDLLLALGFDDECQQRFIQSAGRRHAVSHLLQEDRVRPGDDHQALWDGGALRVEHPPAAHSHGRRPLDHDPPGSGGAHGTQDPFGGLEEAPLVDDGQGFNPFSTHDWLLHDSQDMLTDLDQGNSDYWTSTPSQVAGAPDLMAHASHLNTRADGLGTSVGAVRQDTETAINTALKRCFLDAPISCEGGDSTTTCSSALTLLLRNNRKGLSITELQRRLEPGMVPAPARDINAECRLQNDVLFRVLADISARST